LNVSEQTLNRAKFISALIIPAYQQGLVKLLHDANVRYQVFGKNWHSDSDRTPGELAREWAPAAALLHVWPDQQRVHAIDFAARPAIRPGHSAQEMIRRCRDAISHPPKPASPAKNMICAPVIRSLIAAT
jgi:hypothetical protein